MKRARLLVWGILLAMAAWAFGFEPGWLQQRQLALASANWPGAPITIGVASDLHVGAPHVGSAMLRRVVADLNAAKPDLILLPGDFVHHGLLNGEEVSPEAIAAELATLKAPLGVYATLGNHDWWSDGERMGKALEAVGIRVLENSALPLPGLTPNIWLLGIGDDMTGHADTAKALTGIPAEARLIVMLHDPANAPELPRQSILAFAGHTHGGQVRLPLIGALITPGRSPLRHSLGWLPDVPTPTYVSAGIGTSILPVRFNCPPETLVLRLSGKENS
ncbi:MAG: metallophosphoesterase [Azonexus sp.]